MTNTLFMFDFRGTFVRVHLLTIDYVCQEVVLAYP